MITTRSLAVSTILSLALACGSDDSDGSDGVAPDGSPSPGQDAGQDAAATGDHEARCMAICADPDPARETCTADDLDNCRRRCAAILKGFGDGCGECFAGEDVALIVEEATHCSYSVAPALLACADRCAGNRDGISAVDRILKCDAFCPAAGSTAACAVELESDCSFACRSRLQTTPAACASCVIALSVPPQGIGDGGEEVCTAEVFVAPEDCAPYCP